MGLKKTNLPFKEITSCIPPSNVIKKCGFQLKSEHNASAPHAAPLYRIHKRPHSPSNKEPIACSDPELKTSEGRTRDSRRQTSWLPCRCVWRLWERRSATNQPITQTTSSLLTLQLTPTLEGRLDFLLEEKQTRKQRVSQVNADPPVMMTYTKWKVKRMCVCLYAWYRVEVCNLRVGPGSVLFFS